MDENQEYSPGKSCHQGSSCGPNDWQTLQNNLQVDDFPLLHKILFGKLFSKKLMLKKLPKSIILK